MGADMADAGKFATETGESTHLPFPAIYHERGRCGCNRGCTFEHRDCHTCFLACLRYLFIVELVSLLCLLVWAVVQPTAPTFDIENVHISGLNTTSLPIIAKTTFVITARNPNKLRSIHYDLIGVTMEVYGHSIGEGSIPPFHQGHKKTTFLSGDIGPIEVTFDSETLALLSTERTNVPLRAKLEVKGRLAGISISHNLNMEVHYNLTVDLTRSSGSQVNYKVCSL